MGGHFSVAEFLLQSGANPNMADNEGRTPLLWACMMGHPGVVELLVRNKADKKSADKKGNTPAKLAEDMAKRYEQVFKTMAK
jgi:uncharacterized protein